MAGPGLKADGHVAAAGVDDALSEDRAQLGHHVLVLVGDNLDSKVKEIVDILKEQFKVNEIRKDIVRQDTCLISSTLSDRNK